MHQFYSKGLWLLSRLYAPILSAECEGKQVRVNHLQDKLNTAILYSEAARDSASVYMGNNLLLTRLYNGQKMYLDTRDLSETPHLAIDGHWEIDITRVFELIVEDGEAVFDIGSTYGYYGLIAGYLGASSTICVDANPIYEEFLSKNLTVNGLIDRSVIVPKAIGGKKGKTIIHLLKDDWNSSTTQDLKEFKANRKVPYQLSTSEEVEVTTVDALVKENEIGTVGVIKLDIEGLEEAAYQGMKQTIADNPKLKLLLEFSPENYKKPEEFFAAIAKDFKHLYVMPSGTEITRTNSYGELREKTGDNWMMLLASKVDLDDALSKL